MRVLARELACWSVWAVIGGLLTQAGAAEIARIVEVVQPISYGAALLLFLLFANLAWAVMAPPERVLTAD